MRALGAAGPVRLVSRLDSFLVGGRSWRLPWCPGGRAAGGGSALSAAIWPVAFCCKRLAGSGCYIDCGVPDLGREF